MAKKKDSIEADAEIKKTKADVEAGIKKAKAETESELKKVGAEADKHLKDAKKRLQIKSKKLENPKLNYKFSLFSFFSF